MNATQRLRRQRAASGLSTKSGEPRKNQRHPELKGLNRKEYHTAYMRKQRKQDRESWSNNQ